MYYEINISKLRKGDSTVYEHFFATAERSISDKFKLRMVLSSLKEIYKEPEFKFSVSEKHISSQKLYINDIMRENIHFHRNDGYAQLYAADSQKIILEKMFKYDKELIIGIVKMWNDGDNLVGILNFLNENKEFISDKQITELYNALIKWDNERLKF